MQQTPVNSNNARTKCEIWTRAMGYCRPISNFNPGKRSEFKERKFFNEITIENKKKLKVA